MSETTAEQHVRNMLERMEISGITADDLPLDAQSMSAGEVVGAANYLRDLLRSARDPRAEAAEAEVARLRAALLEIGEAPCVDWRDMKCLDRPGDPRCPTCRAREVLTRKTPGGNDARVV